jgi:hypothetical protein
MASANLNWSTAKVKDGKLAVELDGEIDSDWRDSFETTVKLLGGGEWGTIKVKKTKVEVSEVSPGAEEKLRHHLESVVDQANASQEPDEPEGEQDSGVDEGEQRGPDAEMTERFRAFAEGQSGSEEE